MLTKRRIIAFYLLIVFLLVVYYYTLGNNQRFNLSVYASFIINGAIWVTFFINEIRKKGISLCMIHWVFCIFFLFFAGMLQYQHNKFPWIGSYSNHQIIRTNILLLVWTVCFKIGSSMSNRRCNNIDERNKANEINYSPLRVMTVLSLLITGYRIISIGFVNLFARSTSSYSISDNGSISILVEKFSMAIVYYSLILSIFYLQKTKNKFPFIINSICILLAYFPTSTSRNAAAGLYIGALLAFFPRLRKGSGFSFLYLFMFMIAFPLLNAFRTVSFSDVSIVESINKLVSNFSTEWLAVDYDAHSMITLSTEYVLENGSTYGYQLLGVIFFFVPRSIWPSKPIASGQFIAQYNKWWFTNVSEPLPAEAIINYGFLGLIVFGVLTGYLLNLLDINYIRKHRENGRTAFSALYYYMIGYFLFVFRGSLNSAIAYLFPFIVISVCLNLYNKRRVINIQ